jgi:hypothetical protein
VGNLWYLLSCSIIDTQKASQGHLRLRHTQHTSTQEKAKSSSALKVLLTQKSKTTRFLFSRALKKIMRIQMAMIDPPSAMQNPNPNPRRFKQVGSMQRRQANNRLALP